MHDAPWYDHGRPACNITFLDCYVRIVHTMAGTYDQVGMVMFCSASMKAFTCTLIMKKKRLDSTFRTTPLSVSPELPLEIVMQLFKRMGYGPRKFLSPLFVLTIG